MRPLLNATFVQDIRPNADLNATSKRKPPLHADKDDQTRENARGIHPNAASNAELNAMPETAMGAAQGCPDRHAIKVRGVPGAFERSNARFKRPFRFIQTPTAGLNGERSLDAQTLNTVSNARLRTLKRQTLTERPFECH